MSDNTDASKEWKAPPYGSPCWIEIPAVDVQACKKFYADLFPTWEWRPATEAYPDSKIAMYSFPGGSQGLSGGITVTTTENQTANLKLGTGFTNYYLVKSTDETQKKAEELGATVVAGRTKEGDHGFHVILKDLEGNRFGIYEFTSS